MITYETLKAIIGDMEETWGDAGKRVVECAFKEHRKMEFGEFLNHCTACGGNWGGMLLTGLRELYPETYKAVPDDMGIFAWGMICNTLTLCGVWMKEKEE